MWTSRGTAVSSQSDPRLLVPADAKDDAHGVIARIRLKCCRGDSLTRARDRRKAVACSVVDGPARRAQRNMNNINTETMPRSGPPGFLRR